MIRPKIFQGVKFSNIYLLCNQRKYRLIAYINKKEIIKKY